MFCSDRFFVFWSVIELRTLVFIGISYSSFKNNFSSLLLFFIVQAIAAFSLLVFYCSSHCIGFTLAFLLKLSIFPFYFWYLNIVYSFPNFILFFSSTFFKLPPLILLITFFTLFNLYLLLFAVVFTLLTGGLVIVFSNDLRFIILGSSVANNSWFIVSQLSGTFVFILFFVNYSLFLYFLMIDLKSLSTGSSVNNSLSTLSLLRLVVLAGLPPFPVFFVKMFTILLIVTIFNRSVFLFFIIVSNVLVLLGYLKFTFSCLINQYNFPSHIFLN